MWVPLCPYFDSQCFNAPLLTYHCWMSTSAISINCVAIWIVCFIGQLNMVSTTMNFQLIRKFLQAGMMHDGLCSKKEQGMPQGSPLSPLLSNIMLHGLDKELHYRGYTFVRYADDCNIYVASTVAF